MMDLRRTSRSPTSSPPAPTPRVLGQINQIKQLYSPPTRHRIISPWGSEGQTFVNAADCFREYPLSEYQRAAATLDPWAGGGGAIDGAIGAHLPDEAPPAAPQFAAYVTGVPVDYRGEALEAAYGTRGRVARVELLPIRFPDKGTRSALVFFVDARGLDVRRPAFPSETPGDPNGESRASRSARFASQAALATSPLHMDGAAVTAKRFNQAGRPSVAIGRAERHALAGARKGEYNWSFFHDPTFRRMHQHFETLKRDAHSSKSELKGVESDRETSLQS